MNRRDPGPADETAAIINDPATMAAIRAGEADIGAGDVVTGEEFLADWRARHGDHLASAAGVAAAIHAELTAREEVFALRLLGESVTAGFRSLPRAGQERWLKTPPPATGDGHWDSLLAGVAEHLATTWGHPIPGWTSAPVAGGSDWFPAGPPGILEARTRARTWPELARRGIWLDENDLIAV